MPSNVAFRRTSGVLLHPTSLPGPFGIGDLGPGAHRWLDTLAAAGQGWWQVLPVGPTGYGDSPYQSPSAFAGNPNLISPESLLADRLISATDLHACEHPAGPVAFESVIGEKRQLIATAWKRFPPGLSALRTEFDTFRDEEDWWADDFALFAALKEKFGGRPWWEWPKPLAMREPTAVETATVELAEAIEVHRFGQFLFWRQWRA